MDSGSLTQRHVELGLYESLRNGIGHNVDDNLRKRRCGNELKISIADK